MDNNDFNNHMSYESTDVSPEHDFTGPDVEDGGITRLNLAEGVGSHTLEDAFPSILFNIDKVMDSHYGKVIEEHGKTSVMKKLFPEPSDISDRFKHAVSVYMMLKLLEIANT